MGIDISGGMFVGAHYDDIEFDEDNEEGLNFGDWVEEQGLDIYSPWYDAEYECCYFGFAITRAKVSDMNEEWLANIKRIADEFKEITGADAWLIGMQDVT